MSRVWRKSSYSVANSACVEIAVDGHPDHGVLVRDSKDPAGVVLAFPRNAWSWFIEDIKTGNLRRL